MQPKYHFASDNTAGICPQAWRALEKANAGYCASYGEDEYTAQASDAFREWFQKDCDVYFVFNGTAANSLALASLCQPYHAVICADCAHIETDECGAPEFFSGGSKIWLAPTEFGKILPEAMASLVTKRTDIHYPRPKALSLTVPTELGTVYQPAEIALLAERAHGLGLQVHLDGARFANAVASLDVSPAELTWKAGVDILCLGGAKNGVGMGEAVIFFDKTQSTEFAYRCKQAGQLASKMRFLAAPWVAALQEGFWLSNAQHANACASRLSAALAQLPGVTVAHPTQANGVFVELPLKLQQGLMAKGWKFYNFIGGASRFMCSWATTEADVDELLADAQQVVDGQ